MWAFYERKSLPDLGDENTNNRLERFWRTLKDYLDVLFSGRVGIKKTIVYLVKWSEEQLEVKYTWALRHRMNIWDSDPAVQELYNEASKVLSDSGCIKFKASIELLREKEMKLFEEDDGVRESIRKPTKNAESVKTDVNRNEIKSMDVQEDKSFKHYKTTTTTCNCTFYIKHSCPCRHILFMRKLSDQSLFDLNTFSSRYYIDRKLGLLADEPNNISADYHQIDDVVSEEDEEVAKVLSPEDKFKVIHPIIDRITEVLVRYGSERFNLYVEELKQVEVQIRAGKSMFEDVNEESNVPKDELPKENISDINENPTIKEKPAKESAESVSKFDLKFMAKPRSRGRPRGKKSKVKFSKKVKVKKSKTLKLKPEVQTRLEIDLTDKPVVSYSQTEHDIRLSDEPILYQSQLTNIINSKPEVQSKIEISSSDEPELSDNKDPIICTYPPNLKKSNAVYYSDYNTLSQRAYLQDTVVDFNLRYLQPNGTGEGGIWIISTELGQLVGHHWWDNPRFKRELEIARPWRQGGCGAVLLPWCEQGHYFLLVAILEQQPKLFILESLGGYCEPVGAGILRDFLVEQRLSHGGGSTKFITSSPRVPRQPPGSNDCGLFVIEYASEIIRDTDNFKQRATENRLRDWFPQLRLKSKRSEIAVLLRKLGEEQRAPGGVLEGEPLLALPDLKPVIRRCGFCREVGHSRTRL